MSPSPLHDLPEFPHDFRALRELATLDEASAVQQLLPAAAFNRSEGEIIATLAHGLIDHARQAPHAVFADFLQTFRLSTQEGRVLLTLAEALLRIPDATSADKLINDLLTQADWVTQSREGSPVVQWAGRALAAGRRFVLDENLPDGWHQLVLKLGDAVFRRALATGVQLMARQFVQGETMIDALGAREDGLRYSFDRLGEAAKTLQDAAAYLAAYHEAIAALKEQDEALPLLARDGISVKLSALHPRLEFAHWRELQSTLLPRLIELGEAAAAAGIPLTVDAEEAERLELCLSLWAQAAAHPTLQGWGGLGLAVQAYQRRAPAVIDWLAGQARSLGHRIPVRLVKGAYWDSEIKRAQLLGLAEYPVYTRKVHTDIAYLACAHQMLALPDCFYPQFATHNAHTLAWLHVAATKLAAEYEVQRLAGMGEAVHDCYRWQTGRPLRVYAPIGDFRTLLPYLVRRLLENGSSQSFVNQLADPGIAADTLIQDPLALLERHRPVAANPRIPLPREIFPERPNSPGFNPADAEELAVLRERMSPLQGRQWQAGPLLHHFGKGERTTVTRTSPADRDHVLGTVTQATVRDVSAAYGAAAQAFAAWSGRPVAERAYCLRQLATQLQGAQAELLYLLMAEGGKTLNDALSEWRETFDFCQYYANGAERLQAEGSPLSAVSGEANVLRLHGRGVFLCISPWNFPLAIFAGQLLAALTTGNTVVAKPASQTALIAHRFIELAYAAGVPRDVLQLLPGPSHELTHSLLDHPALAGVVFTGSSDTARTIACRLAEREGALVPLIAETGGLNAMIADSSALPEQLVHDVMTSAFDSAGQRCSALRILWLQKDIKDAVLKRLKGALEVWHVGDPLALQTDMGPVIDESSRQNLDGYCEELSEKATWLASAELGADAGRGHYLAPAAFLLKPEDLPRDEVFGPVLHICTWDGQDLAGLVERINATGYGLTLGVHSRIESTLRYVHEHARVGNIYLNRNQIGAVVGCQPFGGEGLSGTGFKAGGPHYLLRFCTERVVTTNLAALGVNTSLLDIDDPAG